MDFFETLRLSIATAAPRILLALTILAIGWLIARLLSKAVFALLARTTLAAWATRRLGIPSGRYGHRLERVIGRVTFYAMMVVAIVLALDALDLGVIARPMQAALTEIAEHLPNVLGGVIVLIAGIAAARILGDLAEGLLRTLGFDRFFARHIPLGVSEPVAVTGAPASEAATAAGLSAEAAPSPVPSRVFGQVVTVVVVLLVVLQVLEIMGLESMVRVLEPFLAEFLPNLGVAVLILLAGLWAGQWVKRTLDELYAPGRIAAAGLLGARRLPRMAGSTARAAVLLFAVAMALQQVGVAPELIAIAFALLFGSLCLALALAFGLGGREVAAEIVREEYDRRSLEATVAAESAAAAEVAAAAAIVAPQPAPAAPESAPRPTPRKAGGAKGGGRGKKTPTPDDDPSQEG
jgi:hypothetical protein